MSVVLRSPARMSAPFVRPLLCGAVPLAAGLAVHAVWLATRAPFLVLAGFGVILVGVALTLFGAGTFLGDLRRQTSWTPGARLRAAVAVLLLAGCYPAAAAVSLHAIDVTSRYEVVIRNDGDTALTSCALAGGGAVADVGPIEPGGEREIVLRFDRDDELRCAAADTAGTTHDVVVAGYVTNGLGGRATVTFDGAVVPRVEHR